MSNTRKKHKIKQEKPDTSRSSNESKDRDLTTYIDDRVELLQQVFSVMKPRDVIAMAPEHMKHLPIHSVQELCLEELLGISSKRLCSILDGTEPPSDTESSSASPNISDALTLDSISSDEGALSPKQSREKSNKKSKKCKRHGSHKKKSKGSKKSSDSDSGEKGKTSEKSMLDLLELQARARALRAQLQVERVTVGKAETISGRESDDDIQIKEEPAQVVELISSDDEKPNVEELNKELRSEQSAATTADENKHTVTKRNNLTIIVPVTQATRKIKLNRQKVTVPLVEPISETLGIENTESEVTAEVDKQVPSNIESAHETHDIENEAPKEQEKEPSKPENKQKHKKKKKGKKKHRNTLDNEGSEHDGLILQLSDSEKMDLEDYDAKNSNTKTHSTESDESSEEAINNDKKKK